MTKGDPVYVAYFEWLCSQIHLEEMVRKRYTHLFDILHHREFTAMIPNDDNRIADGRDLRAEFLRGASYSFPIGVSFLEVVVGLSRRIAFQLDQDPEWWAWKLLENIGLEPYYAEFAIVKMEEVDAILDRVIWRTYKPNGKGGFFPLKRTDEDQRKVELWNQMNSYIVNVVGI